MTLAQRDELVPKIMYAIFKANSDLNRYHIYSESLDIYNNYSSEDYESAVQLINLWKRK